MNTAQKIGLIAGALTLIAGAIIVSQNGNFPLPTTGSTKTAIVRDEQSGKCWEVRSDGWTRPAVCPTPTPAIMPRVTR